MCKGKCQNVCASPRCSTKPVHNDLNNLRALLDESETRNPGMVLAPHASTIREFLDELEIARNKATAPAPEGAKEVVLVRMKTPPAFGHISGEAIRDRMIAICGCQGRYDCDCVSVRNKASADLWIEHNAN